jgi:pimeloyl-ACP methyl ester carboxylesterase
VKIALRRRQLSLAGLLLLVGCNADDPVPISPPVTASCPAGLPFPATCYQGTSRSGAPYMIAMPPKWNGRLVVYLRGATPVSFDSIRSLGQTRFLLGDSVAVAITGYRSTTPFAKDAAEDAEDLRRGFVHNFGAPTRTIVWGLSFGGLVAARCSERYRNFDGAIAGCGTVAGALASYYPLLDLRVVYQFYCRNLPRPDERQYQLFFGLDPQSPHTADEVRTRINDCTGIALPAAQRSATQRQNLANILAVTRISEAFLLTNMEAATVLLRILVQDQLGGRNPLSNTGVQYSGSTDDAALNAGVARYTADAQAAASFSASDDPTGKVGIPVITIHAIDDGRAFVENEVAYRKKFEQANTLGRLYQTFTTAGGHCQFTTAESLAIYEALQTWIDTNTMPGSQQISTLCEKYRLKFGTSCRFNFTYQPPALETRMYARQQ